MTLKEKLEINRFFVKIADTILYLFFKSIRFLRRKKTGFDNALVVIVLHKLGDSVFAIPALKAVTQEHSKDIILICFAESESIFKRVINGVKYVNIEKNKFILGGRLVSSKDRKTLRNLNPETIIDLTGSILSASLLYNIRARIIIGINESYYRGIYDNYSPIRRTPHQIDVYLDAVKDFCKPNQSTFNGYPKNFNKSGRVLIHPFAGWAAKEWGFNKFVQLYKIINVNYKCSFIFPASTLKSDVMNEMLNEKIDIIESKNIDHLIEQLDNCRLFISNDSGPLQIAALFGIPTFCIYGPTNPKFHVPYGTFHRYTKKDLICSPTQEKYCFTFGGRYCPHHDCLTLLTKEEVFIELEKFLLELELASEKI